MEKYAGVSIRQFPRETDHGDIVDFVGRRRSRISLSKVMEV